MKKRGGEKADWDGMRKEKERLTKVGCGLREEENM